VETAGNPISEPMNLELTDEEAAVLARELTEITGGARYQLSPRFKTLNAILAKLRPQPALPAASSGPGVCEAPS
jgi:hypothetical protein